MNDKPLRVGLLDSMFLYGETPSTMMHVAGLLPFTPPEGSGPEYLRDIIEEVKRTCEVQAPWNRKLRHPRLLTSPLQSWVVDKSFDIDYHLRRSALPSPGDERELGILVSRLHSNPLDMSRPPWEMHVIEGLEGGRVAIYVKIHHALVDGYSGMQMLQRSLSKDPADMDTPLFFAMPQPKRAPRPSEQDGFLSDTLDLVRGLGGGARSTVGLGKALFNLQFRRRGEFQHLVNSFQAPDTILNRRIGRNRRFSTQQYDLPLLKKLGAERGATVNDVALSIIGGGLRRFLDELGELPDEPLIAFLPVNIRPKGDVGGGNAVGAILASMATDVADPVERLDAVAASSRIAKAQLEGMSQEAILAYSALLLSPAAMQAGLAFTGVRSPLPLAFNVVVSNVPGPKEPRYFRGGRLEGIYPVSIPIHGVALNVTLEGYADTLNFGFVGDRDGVPHLQRLALYTTDALRELQKALGVDG